MEKLLLFLNYKLTYNYAWVRSGEIYIISDKTMLKTMIKLISCPEYLKQ